MKSLYSAFLQSKFYHPAFNAAIFDGPIRTYFAQFHESFALKIYFYFQQKDSAEFLAAKEFLKTNNRQIMMIVYPSIESFSMSFEKHQFQDGPIAVDILGKDIVIGMRCPLEDEQMSYLYETVMESIKTLQSMTSNSDKINGDLPDFFV